MSLALPTLFNVASSTFSCGVYSVSFGVIFWVVCTNMSVILLYLWDEGDLGSSHSTIFNLASVLYPESFELLSDFQNIPNYLSFIILPSSLKYFCLILLYQLKDFSLQKLLLTSSG